MPLAYFHEASSTSPRPLISLTAFKNSFTRSLVIDYHQLNWDFDSNWFHFVLSHSRANVFISFVLIRFLSLSLSLSPDFV